MRRLSIITVFCFMGLVAWSQNLQNGLIVHYPLDGNANDVGPNNLDGTYYANPAMDCAGNLNGATYFDGVNDYIKFPVSPLLKPSLPVTISVRFKWGGGTGFDPIFSLDDRHGVYRGITATIGPNDKLRIHLGDGQGTCSPNYRFGKKTSLSIQANQWYEVAFIIRGKADIDIYVNCEEVNGTYTGNSTGNLAWSSSLSGHIGRYFPCQSSGSGYDYFPGSIDEFRMWDRELTTQEINILCSCSETCCDGENLIEFGNFEGGVPPLDSEYDFVEVVDEEDEEYELIPGTYSIGNGDIANTFCPNWEVLDADCNPKGRFMMINGLTNGHGQNMVFSHSIELSEGIYSFCVDLKRLENCCFDYNPPNVEVIIRLGTILSSGNYSVNTGTDPCDWMNISQQFTLSSDGVVSIEIYLDADPYQDGNDFALDNVHLEKIGNVPYSQINFSILAQDLNPGDNYFNIEATPADPQLDEGCEYTWIVCEYDNSAQQCVPGTEVIAGAPQWGYITNFPGYCCIPGGSTPGLFDMNKFYKISRTVDCECAIGGTVTYIVQWDPQGFFRIFNMEEKDKIDFYAPKKQQINSTFTKYFIHPNPSKDQITIEVVSKKSGLLHLIITNMNGKVVVRKEQTLSKGTQQIIQDVSALTAGVYICTLRMNGEQVRQKLIIE